MATVTSMTADRMLAIEQQSIVTGFVDVNGKLLLQNRAGTQVDAGLVKGADGAKGAPGNQGPPGPAGPLIPGIIVLYPATPIPLGWYICDGRSISKLSHLALFNVLGYKYGGQDDWFNLPDIRGRVPVGLDANQTDFNNLGKKAGAKTHQLTTQEMPSHGHSIGGAGSQSGVTSPALIPTNTNDSGGGNNRFYLAQSPGPIKAYDNGGNQPHNILQPYITMTYIIKY